MVAKGPYDIDGPLNFSSIKREDPFLPPGLVPRPLQTTKTCTIIHVFVIWFFLHWPLQTPVAGSVLPHKHKEHIFFVFPKQPSKPMQVTPDLTPEWSQG